MALLFTNLSGIFGPVANAKAFGGAKLAFSMLTDHGAKERKRHGLALEKLQRAKDKWKENRMKRLDFINKRLREKNEARAYINIVDQAMLEYYGVFTRKIKPVPSESQFEWVWNYLQKTSGSLLSTKIIKQTHKTMMKHRDGKDVLAGEYRELPVFLGYHIFAPACHIEKHMEGVIFRFDELKRMDLIMAATNLFGNIINIHPFEDGNGRICRLILAHVLIQMKCCLFPVILSSFHRRGRRHYIRAAKIFDRKPSMLYTMIVKSLIHC